MLHAQSEQVALLSLQNVTECDEQPFLCSANIIAGGGGLFWGKCAEKSNCATPLCAMMINSIHCGSLCGRGTKAEIGWYNQFDLSCHQFLLLCYVSLAII